MFPLYLSPFLPPCLSLSLSFAANGLGQSIEQELAAGCHSCRRVWWVGQVWSWKRLRQVWSPAAGQVRRPAGQSRRDVGRRHTVVYRTAHTQIHTCPRVPMHTQSHPQGHTCARTPTQTLKDTHSHTRPHILHTPTRMRTRRTHTDIRTHPTPAHTCAHAPVNTHTPTRRPADIKDIKSYKHCTDLWRKSLALWTIAHMAAMKLIKMPYFFRI